VRFRRGPAAVTGDKGCTTSLLKNGKTRPEVDPEARRPARRMKWLAGPSRRGVAVQVKRSRMKYGIPTSKGAGIFYFQGQNPHPNPPPQGEGRRLFVRQQVYVSKSSFRLKPGFRTNVTGCRIRACPGPDPGSGMTSYLFGCRNDKGGKYHSPSPGGRGLGARGFGMGALWPID
jgi:hypothetical protein